MCPVIEPHGQRLFLQHTTFNMGVRREWEGSTWQGERVREAETKEMGEVEGGGVKQHVTSLRWQALSMKLPKGGPWGAGNSGDGASAAASRDV
jgi:hypothetical protein